MAEKLTQGELAHRKPIARIKLAQYTWANTVSAAVTKELPFTGVIRQFITVVNDNTGNKTATVAIIDEDSYTLYSLGAIAENATTVTTLTADTAIFVPQGCSVKITPSGDPGASGMTVDVTFIGYAP